MRLLRYFLINLCLLESAYTCRCDKCMQNMPNQIQVPPLMYCKEYTAFDPELGAVKEEDGELFEKKLKDHVRKYHNVAGSIFVLPGNIKKEIYRSAFLSESKEALQELVQMRGVVTLINLHNTNKFNLLPWIEKEKNLFYQFGGQEYIYIPDFNYQFENEEEKKEVINKITYILKLIRKSKGNVLIHCMGGEHRSGVVYAILHKCYHSIPLEAIIQEYKCHAGWISKEQKGGYNHKNEELIHDFPIKYGFE